MNAIAPPDGAFYLYANVGHLTDDSFNFCKDMLKETGVATAPGIDFDPVHGGEFVRFSFAVSTSQIETAIERMVPWMRSRQRP